MQKKTQKMQKKCEVFSKENLKKCGKNAVSAKNAKVMQPDIHPSCEI
jgi:hypothetical protein